ncbi:MAG: efflux RND transporter periplasmic adaptor subunit [Bacteroidetes bacterium]|nr:efflux RND transporter periplasmic adaptor subunit [Bacteroidota bacterium]MBS1979839.1 efflux RND transporter periplasmic adaptor subunit [Bacteroidota bacterium]
MCKRIPLISLIILMAAASCKKKVVVLPTTNRQNLVLADGFIVEPRSESENVEVPGSLLPVEETQIRAEVTGRIVQLNIEEGKVIKKGALLAKLFDQDLLAQLKKLEVQLNISQRQAARQKELLAINGISQQDYDLSELAVDNLKADIQTTKISISKTEIRAPYDGKLGLRFVSLGAYVSPSDILTTVRQVDQLKLDFSIPEKYAKEISPGYLVKFVVDGGKKDHVATVIATEGNVDQVTRTLRIKAIVKESSPELLPGVFAKIRLQLGHLDNAMMIPTQAVIPQARSKQILLLRKDSVQFLQVETGIRDSVYVQIMKGLKAGDTVVTTGLMSIRKQSKVKITKLNRYGK